MSDAPASLLATRSHLMQETGLPGSDIGIAADPSHLQSGGYHCGAHDLLQIDAVGNDDYSIRQPRDRGQYNRDLNAGNNWASAMDIGDDWPNGGRSAWIRFNNLLRQQLGIRHPALACIRGINYTPDGTTKRRFDCLTHTEGPSQDTVTWHTHVEWWRDTNSTPQQRDACTLRLTAIAHTAITGEPLDGSPPNKIGSEAVFYKAPNGSIVLADGGVRVPVTNTTELNGISPAPTVISLPQALWDRFMNAQAAPPATVDISQEQLDQVKTSAHDGAAGAIDGAVINVATS